MTPTSLRGVQHQVQGVGRQQRLVGELGLGPVVYEDHCDQFRARRQVGDVVAASVPASSPRGTVVLLISPPPVAEYNYY